MRETAWSLGTAALRGAASWSDVFLPEPTWEEYARAAARALNPAEVYIALAIREGVDGATTAFERMYFDAIDRALERVRAKPDEIALLKRYMRQRLFGHGAERKPLVGAYAGHGQLRSFLRLAVLRAFVHRRATCGVPVMARGETLVALLDTLPEVPRVLLRLSLLHGLSIDEIAARARMHRHVAVAKLIHARELVLAASPLDEVSRDVIDVLVDASLGGD
jgi:hypothetical protein